MNRDVDGLIKLAIMDPSIAIVGHMLKVLEFIGPWLTWDGWRKLGKLNKATREWCYSEDAAISLFGLWQEHTESLVEINQYLWDMGSREMMSGWIDRKPDVIFDNIKTPPFVGCFVHFFNGDVDNSSVFAQRHSVSVGLALYRSSLELSDLEKEIAGNSMYEGSISSCVRNDYDDHLPMRGSDLWLLITSTRDSSSIPPYYYLKSAVPKGLKIVLDIVCWNGLDWIGEMIEIIGRAAALELTGLVVYGAYRDMTKILKLLVSALQEQEEGFSSPLECLLLCPINEFDVDKL